SGYESSLIEPNLTWKLSQVFRFSNEYEQGVTNPDLISAFEDPFSNGDAVDKGSVAAFQVRYFDAAGVPPDHRMAPGDQFVTDAHAVGPIAANRDLVVFKFNDVSLERSMKDDKSRIHMHRSFPGELRPGNYSLVPAAVRTSAGSFMSLRRWQRRACILRAPMTLVEAFITPSVKDPINEPV